MAVRYWPIAQDKLVIGSPFGPRAGGFHAGQDFPAADGTPFHAIQSGTVINIGAASGYGQWLVIDSNDEQGSGVWEYGHMWDAFATGLRIGSQVEAGQIIGYVGSNGGSTGPHLHASYMPREYNPRNKINPLDVLQGALLPGAPKPLPAVAQGRPEIFWGIDISNHQGNFDFGRAKSEGFTWATHKVTEGDGYRDPRWVRARDQMRQHFPGLFGGYHFYRKGSDVNRQADLLLDHLGDVSIPVQLDFEDDYVQRCSPDDMWAIINAIQERGMRVFSNYIPRWYWVGRMQRAELGPTPPLWNSDYGNHRAGFASSIYPYGDEKPWAPFGRTPVEILQFSERGSVAGQSVDVNAFRGSIFQLHALFEGRPNFREVGIMSFADEELQKKQPSRSIYRATGDPIDTPVGLIANVDARQHEQDVERLALLGHEPSIELIRRVARDGIVGPTEGFNGGDHGAFVDSTKARAQFILDKIEAK